MIDIAKASDVEAVAQLAKVIVKNNHDNGIDQWSDSYPLYNHFYSDFLAGGLFVIKIEESLIASITILPENDPPYRVLPWQKNHSLVIHRLMVHPELMRKGYGSALFQFAITWAKTNGYESVKVDTHPDNRRMQGLIESLHFQKIGYIESIHRIGYELVL